MELISAIPAAADVPVKKAEGSIQNIGNAAKKPIAAKDRQKIVNTTFVELKTALPSSPKPAISMATI